MHLIKTYAVNRADEAPCPICGHPLLAGDTAHETRHGAGYCSEYCAKRATRQIIPMNRGRPRNARFWVFKNDRWVKLTLRPNQLLSWSKSWHNGEGWSWTGNEWSHTGAGVLNRWGNGGTDCDGKISASGSSFAALDCLQDAPCLSGDLHDGRVILLPAWVEASPATCRDSFAEASGY